MKKMYVTLASLCCGLLMPLYVDAQQTETTQIIIELNNSWNKPQTDEPVVIDLHQIKTSFQVRSAIVTEGNLEIPSQLDDLNGDRKADELAFVINMPANSKKKLNVTLSSIEAQKEYPSRVFATMLVRGDGKKRKHAPVESITVPGTVKTLYNQAIDSCDSLKEVILEEGVESLFWIAIVDCPSLERVVVPQSVTLIEEYAIGYGISSKGGTEEKVGDPVIYGYENSSAQKYAEEYGIKFALIDDVIVYDKSSLTYVIGSNEGAVIYCIYALSDFESVAIDGRIVDSANYTLTEGSTILTFKTDFLDTLKPGKHTVTLNYTNDSVNTVLTVENGDSSKSDASKQMRSPDTGASAVGMIAALGAVIIAGATTTALKKKEK